MSEWNTIDTPPKEDGDFLVWVADADRGKGVITVGCIWTSRVTGRMNVKAIGFGGDWNITHWMDLPEPPK